MFRLNRSFVHSGTDSGACRLRRPGRCADGDAGPADCHARATHGDTDIPNGHTHITSSNRGVTNASNSSKIGPHKARSLAMRGRQPVGRPRQPHSRSLAATQL